VRNRAVDSEDLSACDPNDDPTGVETCWVVHKFVKLASVGTECFYARFSIIYITT
jgi:hypothetical protein